MTYCTVYIYIYIYIIEILCFKKKLKSITQIIRSNSKLSGLFIYFCVYSKQHLERKSNYYKILDSLILEITKQTSNKCKF